MSARASIPATLIAVLLLILSACSQPAATPRSTPDETEAEETEAPETEEPEDDETSILSLETGDCFNVLDEDDQTAEEIDCEDGHEYEVYLTVEIDEDERPDDDEIEELAGDCFGDDFTDFVGVEYADSRWYTTAFMPTEDDWDDGHEVIVCALYDPEEDETEGSAEGSETGQAEETDEPDETEEPDDGGSVAFEFTADFLLDHIPPETLENCREPVVEENYIDLQCPMPDGSDIDFVAYTLAADGTTFQRLYEVHTEDYISTSDIGACPDDIPSERTYTVGGETIGRLACYVADEGYAALVWTDDRLQIVSYASRDDGDIAAVYDWWVGPEAGPLQ